MWLQVRIRGFQLFFLAFLVALGSGRADLSVGQICALTFHDVDGNTFSTADGRVTVVTLTTEADITKAELVGDRVPDYCLGNSKYRMITVVSFAKHRRLIGGILIRKTRQRLDEEATRVQKRYDANKVEKNPRQEIFAVTDFDGKVSLQLGNEPSHFRVLVFGGKGELLKQWDAVPTAEELAAVLKWR
jgi:hypothetical protein